MQEFEDREPITSDQKNKDKRPVDVTLNDVQVRLAQSSAEIEAAQNLRYRVFYEERAAIPTDEMARLQRDFDDFDDICDHLLVVDHSKKLSEQVVGTYRLNRRSVAQKHQGFYTADEYNIDKLVKYPGEILELGRSCVDEAYRNRPTMQMLWRGIAQYIQYHDITLLFGCASLPGVDPDELAAQLSFLYHSALAPESLRPVAVADRYVNMARMSADAYDMKRVLASLPPLIKGYLRLSGYVGDGAVVDHQFNTTDVCVIVETNNITEKYRNNLTREQS